jgi:hypothetical protein
MRWQVYISGEPELDARHAFKVLELDVCRVKNGSTIAYKNVYKILVIPVAKATSSDIFRLQVDA